MPVYLCKPGTEGEEPWKHVVQVYAEPFPLPSEEEDSDDRGPSSPTIIHRQNSNSNKNARLKDNDASIPLRRIRHAELLLVDAIFIQYDRYWLRLVFPGPTEQHQYGGCIALGRVKKDDGNDDETLQALVQSIQDSDSSEWTKDEWYTYIKSDVLQVIAMGMASESSNIPDLTSERRAYWNEKTNMDADAFTKLWRRVQETVEEEMRKDTVVENKDTAKLGQCVLCHETGLYFPSSSVLQLLPQYDDGLDLKNAKKKGKPELFESDREDVAHGAETDVDDDLVDLDMHDDDEEDESKIIGVEPVFCPDRKSVV